MVKETKWKREKKGKKNEEKQWATQMNDECKERKKERR